MPFSLPDTKYKPVFMSRLYAQCIYLAISFIICIIWGSDIHAQEHFYYHYNTMNGLPNNRVNAVTQDKQGNIWVPSEKGITQFNGKSFKTFTTKEGLPTNDIFFSSILRTNEVWLYDNSPNITYIKQDTVHSRLISNPVEHSTLYIKPYYYDYNGLVVATTIDNKNIVVIADSNIFVFDTRKFIKSITALNTLVPVELYTDENLISKCGLSTNGEVFTLAFDSLVFIYDFKTGNVRSARLNGRVDHADQKDNYSQLFSHYFMYMSGNSSLLRFLDINSLKTTTIDLLEYDSNYNGSVMHIIEDSSRIMITSANDFFIEVDNQLQVVDTFRWTGKQKVKNIYRDYSGNYWIATNQDGLIFISKYLYPFKKKKVNGIKNKILNIYSFEGKYFVFDKSSQLHITDSGFNIIRTIPLPVVYKSYPEINNYWCFPDNKGGYYIASAYGHYYLNNSLSLWPLPLDSAVAYKNYCYDTGNNRLAIASSSGLRLFNNGHSMTEVDKYRHTRFMNISQTTDGGYWATNDLGRIIRFDENFEIIKDTTVKGRISFSTSIDGALVYAVEDYGLYYYNVDDNSIKLILPDDNFQYYKRGRSGVWTGNKNYIELLTIENGKCIISKKYLNLEGLLYHEIYNINECDSDSYLLCDNGVVALPGASFTYKNDTGFTSSIYLSSITITQNNTCFFSKTDSIFTYTYSPQNIILNFSCNSLSFLGNVSYKYLVEGDSKGWLTGNTETISYPSLSPGTYKLRIKAVVNNTDLETKECVFTLVVTPLWWQSMLFKIVVFIVIAGAIAAIIFLWVRRIRKQEEWKTYIYKKNAELELSALQSQMNPHFIFNSLSSLQSFIKTNRKEEANELLQKFSTLVRLYLDFSRSRLITLEQELESLKQYTYIEQVRFSNRFKTVFKIRNTTSARLSELKIPPMLIQPFIENAVNHGVRHKTDGPGVIKVFILIGQYYITVVVDDNGIGRKRAELMKNRQFPSIGNTLIKDRIDILNESDAADIDVSIKDKVNKTGNAAGTRVILRVKNRI